MRKELLTLLGVRTVHFSLYYWSRINSFPASPPGVAIGENAYGYCGKSSLRRSDLEAVVRQPYEKASYGRAFGG